MDPTQTVIWIFLAIFVITALIALASLIGWLSLERYYKRNLFKLLILEVVGCVIGFGFSALSAPVNSNDDLQTTLLSHELGWDWQYAEKGWRSRIRFEQAEGGKLTMVGATYLVDTKGNHDAILTWESSEPFDVPRNAESSSFKARREWTEAAASVYPELQYEVGKKTDVTFTVHAEMGLRGAIQNVSSAETWGLVMTPSDP